MQLIHIVGPWPLGTNTFLVISEAGHAVAIDPAADAQRYLDALAEHGASLTHIFLTHGHYDHVGAVQQLMQATGAVLYCNDAELKGDQMFPLPAALPHERWPQGGKVQLDELEFTVWQTPGHTKGGVCILCGNEFFCGDTLFADSCGRIDLPGGSAVEMQRSLSMLANLPLADATRVLPGHGPFTTLGRERRSNPYLLGEVF